MTDTSQATPATLNIRPSPRILTVLGDIEFTAVQALAELVDNAFDDFLTTVASSPASGRDLRVNIALPRKSDDPIDAELVISDTGRGMSLTQLNDAVRAGWSGQDTWDSLGLFGMGFNIATARLGRVCRILTTRHGDSEWAGVEIDLPRLQTQADFEVPIIRRSKPEPSSSGTRIEVSGIHTAQFNQLVRGKAIREALGDLYAPLLINNDFKLVVGGHPVEPRRYCVWDASRAVTFGSGSASEEIAALQEFDIELPDKAVCDTCHYWQHRDSTTCERCGSSNVKYRPRRVTGWIGVQRYLDPDDYGVDWVRNGRKILARDKSVFRWENPNTGQLEIEYPIELGGRGGGRIVGLVDVSGWMRPTYQKNGFLSDVEVAAVKELLRGDAGPLRKRYRAQANYPNYANGPLARIYRAYNEVRPGTRYLIPGDGKTARHDAARAWGRKFHDGEAAYETDQRWWEAAALQDKRKTAGLSTEQIRDEGTVAADVIDELLGDQIDGGLISDPAVDGASEEAEDYETGDGAADADHRGSDSDAAETFIDRVHRWADDYPALDGLEGDVSIPGSGSVLTVSTYFVSGEAVLDRHNRPVPVTYVVHERSDLRVFIDADHPLFQRYGVDPMQTAVAEVSEYLKLYAEADEMHLSEVIARVTESKLADQKQTAQTLAITAEALLRAVRERMVAALANVPDARAAAWDVLTHAEREAAVTAAEAAGNTWSAESSDFISHVPALALPRILTEVPHVFLDGHTFNSAWAALGSPKARWIHVARIAGLLYDAALLDERPVPLAGDALRRAALALPLLEADLAAEGTAS
jgi:RNA polymerase subunit RPABC4/transcription elongation factor Spt4